MAHTIIRVTGDNKDEMLARAIEIAKRGGSCGFDLSALDAGERTAFSNKFDKALNPEVLRMARTKEFG